MIFTKRSIDAVNLSYPSLGNPPASRLRPQALAVAPAQLEPASAPPAGTRATTPAVPEAPAHARPAPRPQASFKPQPPVSVVLHDDPVNTIDYVVGVLMWVLRCGKSEAVELTMKAHHTGRSVIWSGTREHAELKAGQVRSCGPDPAMAHRGARPLGVTIEALPGA